MNSSENNVGKENPLLLSLTISTLTQASLSWVLFIFPPIAIAVASTLDVDPVYVGFQAGLLFLTTICATLYSGQTVSKFGAVATMQIATVIALIGIVLCALNNIVTILIGSMLFGYCHSVVNPCTAVVLRQFVTDKNRSLVFSIKQCSVPIGLLLSSLCGPFIAERYDWRFAMLPLAVFLIIMFFTLFKLNKFIKIEVHKPSKNVLTIPINALSSFWNNYHLRIVAFVGLSFGMCQSTLLTFTSNMFVEEIGVNLQVAGYVLLCIHIGGVFGRILWGHLADRIADPGLIIRILAILIFIFMGLIALLPNSMYFGFWLALFFLIGYTAVGWNGIIISEFAHQSKGENSEQQMAGAFFILFSGGAFGPLIFPMVYATLDSYALSIAFFGVFFGIVATILIRKIPKDKTHHHLDPPLAQDV